MNDLSPMPFGKFKGEKLEDVPASYLLWLWNEGVLNELRHHELRAYVIECFAALEKDAPNVIVKDRPI